MGTIKGEDNFLNFIDAQKRKYRERIGLDTRVVYTVNDEYSVSKLIFLNFS